MTLQERREYIAEKKMRKSVKMLLEERPNVTAFYSWVYAHGKRYDIDIKMSDSKEGGVE